MSVEKLARIISDSAAILESKEDYLSAIDSETGDGDHGVTVSKIARAVIAECDSTAARTPSELLSDISVAVMGIDGGSAGPLWAMLFDGASEAIGDADMIEAETIGVLLGGAIEGLGSVSDAKQGMKTMLDALAPAAEAAERCEGELEDVLAAAAQAAEEGAESTRDMLACYGRAKNLKEDSRGHLDPGAVGIALFLRALSDVYNENV